MLTLSLFKQKYPFWANLVPKFKIICLKPNLVLSNNLNMQNSLVMFTFSVFNWKYRVRLNASWFAIHNEILQLNSLLSWSFSQQDKKIKITEIINGSGTFKWYESYVNTLNTELGWLCSFFMYWSFPYCPQLCQLTYKHLNLEFAKNMIKALLIWLMYLTL